MQITIGDITCNYSLVLKLWSGAERAKWLIGWVEEWEEAYVMDA